MNKQGDWQEELEHLHARLHSGDIAYIPIRHHSPACAWHLKKKIAELEPASILIEGPESLTPYIKILSNPETVAPVALYTHFTDRLFQTVDIPKEERTKPPKYSSYYPLCDYSPELVAIREGVARGARVAFCDLDYPEQIMAETGHQENTSAMSLFREHQLTQNEYLNALSETANCRDFNEFWDKAFEGAFLNWDGDQFWKEVATYCYFARLNTSASQLQLDGTLARELRMWEIIQLEKKRLKKSGGLLMVITGGFHTPPLALGQVDKKVTVPKLSIQEDDFISAPISYSFRLLDSLNGYGAGMPSPDYYQVLWEHTEQDLTKRAENVTRHFLSALAHKSREQKLSQPLSTADVIGAYQQACLLARFRGNMGPMREDLLDGIRSSFVKGSLDTEGQEILRLAYQVLCGERMGALPENVPVHPLISDFRYHAAALQISTDTSKEVTLEIYTKPKHQKMSRFFHLLYFLNVPFAQFKGGPDFVRGHGLELQREHWSYHWNPHTDASLIELSHLGTTIEEVVINQLVQKQEEIIQDGCSQGSPEAVTLLLLACRLGISDRAMDFIHFVKGALNQEGSFTNCITSLSQLDLLLRYQSPLENKPEEHLPGLLEIAFHRSCYLIRAFHTLPDEEIPKLVEALPILRECLSADRQTNYLDPEVLWMSIQAQLDQCPSIEPTLKGGLTGLLWQSEKISKKSVLLEIKNQFQSSDDKGNCLTRFLLGLFLLCREATWSDTEFMEELNAILVEWDEETFYRYLPELRLAFTQHTPQETDRVAKVVARINDTDNIGEWYKRDLDESLVLESSQAWARLTSSLAADHLNHFIES